MAVPEDYQRRQTVKSAERFITPELKAFEDKVLGARDRALAREKELYEATARSADRAPVRCCKTTAGCRSPSSTCWPASPSARRRSIACSPSSWRSRCCASRAAVIRWSSVQAASRSFRTTLCFDDSRRMLIITGPNMGGKSTYMRQTALIVILAHIGCFVPAKRAVLGPLDRIFTRIGASDDLAGGRSTFMLEMTETANILHNATDQSLVLMDEVGRGTSTFDGLSLAWACAAFIAKRDSRVHLVRDPLLRAHRPRRRDARGWRTCTSKRSSTATRSVFSAQREGGPREPELRIAGRRARRHSEVRDGPRRAGI